ncbi:MAG: hypothetical protein GY909_18800 [Oligoflexia bacterium]|nr:hypothetical protein [Oligoflexia bacterium]
MNLINFHCHHLASQECIEVLSTEEINNDILHSLNKDKFFTIGLHPWKLQDFPTLFPIFKEMILKYKDHPQFLGAGEFGIDKVKCEVSLKEQEECLKEILLFLKEQKIQTFILHNVKAHAEIIRVFESCFDHLTNLKVVFHDFNGNAQMIKEISNKLNPYFSIGPTYYKKNSKISSDIESIPLDKLFLETDDSDISIQDHYLEIERKLNLEEKLAKQCLTNFLDLREVLR